MAGVGLPFHQVAAGSHQHDTLGKHLPPQRAAFAALGQGVNPNIVFIWINEGFQLFHQNFELPIRQAEIENRVLQWQPFVLEAAVNAPQAFRVGNVVANDIFGGLIVSNA